MPFLNAKIFEFFEFRFFEKINKKKGNFHSPISRSEAGKN
jgi:hypothetical protein